MKTIGLAVCFDSMNYGSQLQLMANANMIQDLGYKSEIINYKKKVTPRFIVQNLPRLFNMRFVVSKIRRYYERGRISRDARLKEKICVRKKRFRAFAVNNFPKISEPYIGWEMLVRGAKDHYDGFLCGSDQLWLPNNLGSHFYTLEFAPDDKVKIAYATSFGVSRIPKNQEKATAEYLNRFHALSTREIAGSEIIKSITGKNVPVVCDPTLLYDDKEWACMIPNERIVEKPYIFAYFLGNNIEHRKIAEKIGEETGFQVVTTPFLNRYLKYDYHFGDLQMFDIDSAGFVNLIRHAEYVLTDSFHGTVFSVINHKRFLVFDRFKEGKDSRNSRIESLCTLLELKNRRYCGNMNVIYDEIDYRSVENRLKTLRDMSIQYLKNALNMI